MEKKEVGEFIPCDSPICKYCVHYEDPDMCGICYEFDEFVGIECYETPEDKC